MNERSLITINVMKVSSLREGVLPASCVKTVY